MRRQLPLTGAAERAGQHMKHGPKRFVPVRAHGALYVLLHLAVEYHHETNHRLPAQCGNDERQPPGGAGLTLHILSPLEFVNERAHRRFAETSPRRQQRNGRPLRIKVCKHGPVTGMHVRVPGPVQRTRQPRPERPNRTEQQHARGHVTHCDEFV